MLDHDSNIFKRSINSFLFQAKSTVIRVKQVTGNVTVKENGQYVTGHNQTNLVGKVILTRGNSTVNTSFYNTFETIKKSGKVTYGGGTNILGLVLFSLAVGMVAGKLGDKAKPFVDFISILNDIVMYLVGIVMW